MLDPETRRRIDTCRDILVGKVPDPKSQVEQITIALIYKFMDDMDLQSEEMGGKRNFFSGDFERYRWAKLVAKGVGGQDMLNTYSEALTKMVENERIPALFRSIFQNAYLPYRDPETLRSFLREIDGFTYDHSERLGDAFEYLLSVLGSQGDAGQFRTPRHIIDFMVDVIAPKKTETILDPACGTAGFLISAYKHILKTNSTNVASVNGNGQVRDAAERAVESPMRYPGDQLTAEDRERLARNIKGYDISPDMVRLSLVNLYLHGFADPKVEEYDTLTSEDKWTETADVILANPPFMSPKGGIKPHTRFQVQSKRSEVLFVDYIAEHLTPQGRAAVIVPEGVIFQSQSAYVALRKMLVEKFLAAVVSLPAGVFNPYSGVKTSILIFDRAVAKASNHVAFFKIENDGFNLGAQRRAIKGTQLPQVKEELSVWLDGTRAGKNETLDWLHGSAISKDRLAEGGNYNLSGDRYREGIIAQTAWPMVRLGEVADRLSGGTPSKGIPEFWQGEIPWVSPKDMKSDLIVDTEDHISEKAVAESATSLVPEHAILCVVRSGILKHSFPVAITSRAMCFNQDLIALLPDQSRLLPHFLFWTLKGRTKEILDKGIKPGVTVQSFHSGFFEDFAVPLPPLDVQREIVAELEGYQIVIDGARAIVNNYRPHIPVDPAWPLSKLGDHIISAGVGVVKNKGEQHPDLPHPYIKMHNITANGRLDLTEVERVRADETELSRFTLEDGDFMYNTRNAPDLVGKSAVFHGTSGVYLFNNNIVRIKFDRETNPDFVNIVLNGPEGKERIRRLVDGTTSVAALYQRNFETIEIPFPSLNIQQTLVDEIETEQAIVEGNRKLISRFEKKIETAIARVWGEATANAEAA